MKAIVYAEHGGPEILRYTDYKQFRSTIKLIFQGQDVTNKTDQPPPAANAPTNSPSPAPASSPTPAPSQPQSQPK